jgi:hypothetical protein
MGRKKSLEESGLCGDFPCYPCFLEIKGAKNKEEGGGDAQKKTEMFS